jgi:hypothetical protein
LDGLALITCRCHGPLDRGQLPGINPSTMGNSRRVGIPHRILR